MRTTINLDDELLKNVKLRAAEQHRTMTAVIEDALRFAIEEKPARAPKHRIRVPTSGSGGLQPGVDLDDTASLLDRMERTT